MTDFRARGTIMGLAGLTAVFGMGTGVTPPVWSPESARPAVRPGRALWFRGWSHTKSHCWSDEWCLLHDELRQRPLLGSTRPGSLAASIAGSAGWAAGRSGWSSCSAVRTGRLRRSPAVHARPIDLVVFQEPSHYCWKPHLGGGFALRCLQRLSCPDLATRRCPERDSRHTRGRSSPILSY